MVYNEAGQYEKSIKFLEENQKYILDKLTLEEMRADSSWKGNQKAKAIKIYEDLIERNPDNLIYYKKLEECLNLSNKYLFMMSNNFQSEFWSDKLMNQV